MQRHVTEAEAHTAVAHARATATIIPDNVAGTIAAWWHSPSPADESITRLSHGMSLTPHDYGSIIRTCALNAALADTKDHRMALVALSHWALARSEGRDTY